MPREGASYDQVATVANAMVAANIKPTLRNIREELGSGSISTIQKHLAKWRATYSLTSAETSEMPVQITKAFSHEISRVKAEARAEIEEQLILAQAEAAYLAEAGEMLEAELDKRAAEIVELTTARDMLLGQIQEQDRETERLSNDNKQERNDAEIARTEVAQLRNMLQSQSERLAELVGTVDRLMSANASEAQARVDAEKSVAVFSAKLESELERSKTLNQEKEALLEQVTKERHSGEEARISAAKTANKLEHLAATLVAKESSIRELSEFFEVEKNALRGSEMKITTLNARLEEQDKTIKHLHGLFSTMSPKNDIQILGLDGSGI